MLRRGGGGEGQAGLGDGHSEERRLWLAMRGRGAIAALAALFWKCTTPGRLWSNQKPNQQTKVEGVIDWPLSLIGKKGARHICLKASQWMALVSSGANGMLMDVPWVVREPDAAIGLRESCPHDVERLDEMKCHLGNVGGQHRWQRRVGRGEPCGAPTEIGAERFGTRVMGRLERRFRTTRQVRMVC